MSNKNLTTYFKDSKESLNDIGKHFGMSKQLVQYQLIKALGYEKYKKIVDKNKEYRSKIFQKKQIKEKKIIKCIFCGKPIENWRLRFCSIECKKKSKALRYEKQRARIRQWQKDNPEKVKQYNIISVARRKIKNRINPYE